MSRLKHVCTSSDAVKLTSGCRAGGRKAFSSPPPFGPWTSLSMEISKKMERGVRGYGGWEPAVTPTGAKSVCSNTACPKQTLPDLEPLMTSRVFYQLC